jgi:predicted phosphoribosyltransferase
MFENRHDAGRQLASALSDYGNQAVVVLAVPNGGVPVAIQVAAALGAELDLVITRKSPSPLSPEGGIGAVADDGTIILNDEVIRRLGLNRQQIEHEVNKVRAKVKERSLLYKGESPPVRLSGRTAIVIDDGLASGFTMTAAAQSVRHRRPREVVVAVPAASALAIKQVERVADNVVTCATGYMPKFYISDYYRYWHDLKDEEVTYYLRQWRVRHLR